MSDIGTWTGIDTLPQGHVNRIPQHVIEVSAGSMVLVESTKGIYHIVIKDANLNPIFEGDITFESSLAQPGILHYSNVTGVEYLRNLFKGSNAANIADLFRQDLGQIVEA